MAVKSDLKRVNMGLAQVTASAVTPDQLIPYVRAVSGLDSRMFGSCVGHFCEGQIVLIGYPLGSPRDKKALDAAVDEALQTKGLKHITVLCAEKPSQTPESASCSEDAYWSLPLPLPPCRQKLRNMLSRAKRDVTITESGAEGYGAEHEAMAENFCSRRRLEAGMVHIFRQLKTYLAESPEARLFSARTKDGALAAFAIGDYSSFHTAFYMFACRLPSAPPGTADALLEAVAECAEERGHSRLNLGLGINQGVAFFKKKWGAENFLPCYEYGWDVQPQKKGFLARLFG